MFDKDDAFTFYFNILFKGIQFQRTGRLKDQKTWSYIER